ncbi:MAG: hypothetical protein WBL67_04690 [Nitrososphaeraceae archaeon]
MATVENKGITIVLQDSSVNGLSQNPFPVLVLIRNYVPTVAQASA